ncbi:hypothetical protein J4447_01235 [Candidatus Pacearchaeota archaeon]|nr:hypothetical protein [Candidatus Pacearchaeota archaeon]
MDYNSEKREIKLDKELSRLDKLVLRFLDVIKKHVDYVIISGYISILFGRSRATEDVDIFIKPLTYDEFAGLYKNLKMHGFWCLNAENPEEIYNYLKNYEAARFAEEGMSIPNFEMKFPKREIDKETFTDDSINVIMPEGTIKISSLERQVAFKKYYLKSDKDLEDARHIEEVFKGKIDYDKINKLKVIIDNIWP